jgi:hypothetical protein
MDALRISFGLGNDGVSGHGVDHFTEMILLKQRAHYEIPTHHPNILTSQRVY